VDTDPSVAGCAGCSEWSVRYAKLEERFDALVKRVEELEARLKKDSSNSSRPPSSDAPWKTRAPRRTPSGRRPGGQPGHEGTTRPLVPPERLDESHDVRPTECSTCGSKELDPTGEAPYRHQVTELPPIRAHITEHRLHAMQCRGCGARVVAALAPGVPRGRFGPRLEATVAYLSGGLRLTKREIQRFFDELLGVDLGLGTIPAIEDRVARALEWSYRDAQRLLREGDLSFVDETSWREALRLAWLWGATNGDVAVFHVDRRRNRGAFRRLFAGVFRGFLVTDRLAVYDSHRLDRRQTCNAHLLRDLEGLVAGPRAGRAFGQAGRRILGRLFGLWHRFQEGLLSRERLTDRMGRVRTRLVALLEGAREHTYGKVRRFAAKLLSRVDAVFGFLRCARAETTNNRSERLLRKAVLWRRSSHGTASASGSRFVERILTAVATLRMQDRGVLDFIVASLIAACSGAPPPSLRPPRPAT